MRIASPQSLTRANGPPAKRRCSEFICHCDRARLSAAAQHWNTVKRPSRLVRLKRSQKHVSGRVPNFRLECVRRRDLIVIGPLLFTYDKGKPRQPIAQHSHPG